MPAGRSARNALPAAGPTAPPARNAVRAFHAEGVGRLARKPPVARTPAAAGDRRHDGEVRDLPHRSPRTLGKPTGLRTLAPVAEVGHAKGWTARRLSAEGVRSALKRPGVGRKRAKHRTASPGPDYARKKGAGPADRPGGRRPGLGARVPGRVPADPAGPAGPVRPGRRRPAAAGGRRPGPEGGGPEAVACYGVPRADTGGMILRFRDGRPVGATTEDLPGWGCEGPAAEGRRVLALVWDNAAWHVSDRVRGWVAAHNRRVRRAGAGPGSAACR